MGKRSRARRPPGPRPPREPRPDRSQPGREKGLGRLPAPRRVLALYLGAATVVALVALLGIALIGGTAGPFLVFAVVAGASGLVYRRAQRALVGLGLSDEDRLLQTMAAGLLLISSLLALVSVLATSLS
ncbi:hypothetical protein GKE82_02860 [Conexibacter sp. W3-3-2]|uniref:hypothetical protein n=1 Tax=Conexibacter sp. W3-3-2 TaxID=2675227 RepID=UPI0012B820F4|nr:hypothetical protein [Conexibacter sp. W3-3-2]MTD43274.1 hypothetical protein [Conexibacter sp. W3-3-2]